MKDLNFWQVPGVRPFTRPLHVRRERWIFPVLFVFLVTLPLVINQRQVFHWPWIESGDAAQSDSAPPGGLSSDEWQSIQEQIRQAEYNFTWQTAQESFSAPNRYHGWQSTFSRNGVNVRPAEMTGEFEAWSWQMRLQAYGYAGMMRSVTPAAAQADNNQVRYIWDDTIDEWWINDPNGLEQGFTLRERPPGACSGCPLLIDLSLETSLIPVPDGSGIRFSDAAGETVLRYHKLVAFDANGRPIPAEMVLGDGIQLQIDDESADYPLTIDPLLISELKKITAPDGLPGDLLGTAVSISSDTLVVGAPGHNEAKGAAYIFTRNEGGADHWGLVQKLANTSFTFPDDQFGRSVSISGDTVVIGARNFFEEALAQNNNSQGSEVGTRNRSQALDFGAAFIFERNEGGINNWGQVKILSRGELAQSTNFGVSVAISVDTVVVGASTEDGEIGAAYVYGRNQGGPDNWGEVQEISGGDSVIGDHFGVFVAISGDTIAAGANGHNAAQGAAYVFERNQGGQDNWGQVQKLVASDGLAKATFGDSVSIFIDTVVVGAGGSGGTQGAAYVYERNQGGPDNWGEVQKLTAADGVGGDFFGTSVSVSYDKLVAGAYGADSAAGAVYVYSRNAGGADNWGMENKLSAADAAAGDQFGISVSIDANTIAVGASAFDSDTGAAYTFEIDAHCWVQSRELASPEDSTGEEFGSAVAVSGDTLIVGMDEFNDAQGAAYIFTRNESGTDNWGLVQTLTASDAEPFRFFGISVDISGDTAVVGRSGTFNVERAAYVFERNHGGQDNWGEVTILTASDGLGGELFAESVSISADTIAVEGSTRNNFQGAVYVYGRNKGGPDNWGEVQIITANDGVAGDQLGSSVAISGDTIVAGARGDDTGRGAAYVFERNQGGADNWGQVKKLIQVGGVSLNEVGTAVAIDVDIVVVGVFRDGDASGAALIFERNEGGADNWGEVQKIKDPNAPSFTGFGTALDISGDNIIVGASGTLTGNAYVFNRNIGGADNWGFIQAFTASMFNDGFGRSVSISGNVLAVGAPTQDSANGAVYVYQSAPCATLEVVKDVDPDDPETNWEIIVSGPAAFEGTLSGDDTTGTFEVFPGEYTISELAGDGTNLAFYDSSFSCVIQDEPGLQGAGTTIDMAIAQNEEVVCTFTNTRKTAVLTVIKDLEPQGDDGLFIMHAGEEAGTPAGSGAEVSAEIFVGASVEFSETAVPPTSLDYYDTVYECDNGGPSGSGASSSFIMPDNDLTCTFTNTRKMKTLTVVKALAPAGDPGLFIMDAGGVLGVEGGHGAQSSSTFPVGGNISFGELAGSGTSLADYAGTYSCNDPANTSGSGGTGIVPLPDADVICTIFNVRSTAADLKLQKFVKPDGQTIVGEPFEFFIFVDNLGPAAATNVTVDDDMFAHASFDLLSVSDDRDACSVTPQSGSAINFQCTLDELAHNERWKITAEVVTNSALDVNNEARVYSPDQADPNEENNSDTAEMHVIVGPQDESADLSLTKFSEPGAVFAGESFDYRLSIHNAGPSPAKTVQLVDVLPAGVRFDSAQIAGLPAQACVYAPGSHRLDCNLGDLPANSSLDVIINVTADPDLEAGQLENSAQVSSPTSDPQDGNNDASAQTAVDTAASLTIQKVASVGSPATGDVFFYTIDVQNHGPSAARDVQVWDEVTGSVDFLYSPDAECLRGEDFEGANCTLGDLDPGETRQLTLYVQVKASVRDQHLSDNEVCATTPTLDISGDPIRVCDKVDIVFRNVNDLQIHKYGKPDGNAEEGQVLLYTIVVDNFGPGNAFNTKVRDLMSSDGAYSYKAPDFCSPASAEVSGNAQFNCSLGVLTPGEQKVFTVEVTAHEAQSLNNRVNVNAQGTDLDVSNNHASVEHDIIDVADLSAAMGLFQGTVMAGDQLKYTAEVTNHGPSTAANAQLQANLSAGATVLSMTSSHGTCAVPLLECGLGSLETNETATIEIVVRTQKALGPEDVIEAGVLVTAETYDDDNSNNQASALTEVEAVRRLRLTMSSSVDRIQPGQTFDLQVTAYNEGWGRIQNVLVDIQLSDLLLYVFDSAVCGPGLSGCNLGDIEPGGQATMTISVLLADNAAPGSSVDVSSSVSTQTGNVVVDDSDADVVVTVGGDRPNAAQSLFLPLIRRP